jgi:hypothetical protein
MLHQLPYCVVVVVQVLDCPVPIIIHRLKPLVARLQSPGVLELAAEQAMPPWLPLSPKGDLRVYHRERKSRHWCSQLQRFSQYITRGFKGYLEARVMHSCIWCVTEITEF